MPWCIKKKPLLILTAFGYMGFAHIVIPRIMRISQKYARLIRQEMSYVRQVLIKGNHEFSLKSDADYVIFRRRES